MFASHARLLFMLTLAALTVGGCIAFDNSDPGNSDEQPLMRWGEPDQPTNSERGNVMINEIHFDGSVTDDGVWDPDDIFIELLNKNPRPVNFSGWRLLIHGDYERSYRLPNMARSVGPNEYLVIAKKRDGAFADIADVFIEDLKLGRRNVEIVLRDIDHRLIDDAGHRYQRVFAGGYDTVTVRSMERTQVLFGNRGNLSRNWHAYSTNEGFPTIREGWRENTLASPGSANSADYAGSTTSGSFE